MKVNFLNSFKRITSKGNYIAEIDGLRFLAILPVVLMHTNTNYNRTFNEDLQFSSSFFNVVINQGGKGVWIFFAISGFILSYAFAKHFWVKKDSYGDLDLKSYFYRRITRLEPPFIISTILIFLAISFIEYKDFSTLAPNLLATLFYLHNIIYGEWSPINPVTWSLEIEVQFYIIAPFLCALLFKLGEKFRNIILISLILFLPFLVFHNDNVFVTNSHFSRTLPTYFHHFLVGVLLASVYTGKLWNRLNINKLVWDLLTIIAIIVIFYLEVNRNNKWSYNLFDFCLFIILIGAFKGKFINRFFSNSYIATIGGMCYSIYLLHYAIIFSVMKVLKFIVFENTIINYSFHVLASVIAVSIISLLFFKFFEKPYMDKDWPSKFVKKIKNWGNNSTAKIN